MRLEPVDAEGHPAGTRAGIPEGTLEIGLARQQLMGVHTEEVKRTAISHRLRVPGRVAPDEGRVYPLIAAAEGWIRNLGQNPAGTFVKKGQILASYDTPNFQTARQGLLFGANADRPWLHDVSRRPSVPASRSKGCGAWE